MTDDTKLVQTTGVKRRPPNAGKGRPKGVPNKSTMAVKEALHSVFHDIGGVERMATWAREEPGEFYKLYAKMLPAEVKTELTGKDGGPIDNSITIRLVAPTSR